MLIIATRRNWWVHYNLMGCRPKSSLKNNFYFPSFLLCRYFLNEFKYEETNPIYMQLWQDSRITQLKYKCLHSRADPLSVQITQNLFMVCKLLKSLELWKLMLLRKSYLHCIENLYLQTKEVIGIRIVRRAHCSIVSQYPLKTRETPLRIPPPWGGLVKKGGETQRDESLVWTWA